MSAELVRLQVRLRHDDPLNPTRLVSLPRLSIGLRFNYIEALGLEVVACLRAEVRIRAGDEHRPFRVLEGYNEMKENPQAPPVRVTEAVERIVTLYEAWGKRDKADEYRAMLPDGDPQP